MRRNNFNHDEVIRRVVLLTERPAMRKLSADPISLYPDSPKLAAEYTWNIAIDKRIQRDPDELLIRIVILAAVKPFWYELFLDYCGQQAYRYAYQGKWMFVHKLVKLQHILLILEYIENNLSSNEFFGNWINKMEQFAEKPDVRFIKMRKPNVRRPVRKRGYNDKGSKRASHEVHSAWKYTGPNPYRLDLRSSYSRKQALTNFLYD